MASSCWCVDESYYAQGGKCEVVVAAVRVVGDPGDVRAELLDLVLRPNGYLHFHDERTARRQLLADAIGRLPVEAVVAARSDSGPVERARSLCLAAVVRQRHADIDELVIESRSPKGNRRDEAMLARLWPPQARVRVRFVGKRDDPLVWLPDIVAGSALQAFFGGRARCFAALGRVPRIDA